MPTIEELRAFIAACAERMSAIADTAATESRSAFDDGEQAEWDQLNRWVAEGNTLIERQEAIGRAAAAGQTVAGFHAPNVNTRKSEDPFDVSRLGPRSSAAEVRGQALAAIESQKHTSDAVREAATRTVERCDNARGDVSWLILETGSDLYRSAYAKYISGQERAQTPEEQRAASTTTTEGGYKIPFNLDPTIILTNTGVQAGIRGVAKVVRGTSNKWNGVSTAGVTASWDGEAAEVSDDAPTLAQPSIEASKAQAFVPFSIEVGQDWPNMEGDITELMVDAKERLDAAAFATGSGTNQPVGIVTALVASSPTVITTSITTDTFAVADVYALFEALGARSRSKSTWAANLSILNKIRQFATANNYHGFTVDMTADGIPSLLGRPVVESSSMDGTYGTGDNYNLVVGDFSNYVIYERIGMTVEYVPHLFATGNNRPSGQRGIYAYWRVGADSVNDNAFRILNVT